MVPSLLGAAPQANVTAAKAAGKKGGIRCGTAFTYDRAGRRGMRQMVAPGGLIKIGSQSAARAPKARPLAEVVEGVVRFVPAVFDRLIRARVEFPGFTAARSSQNGARRRTRPTGAALPPGRPIRCFRSPS